MKGGSKGSKYICFMNEKPKYENQKDEPHHKVPISGLHQKVHILEVPSNTTKVTTTLDLATKVHAMAIQSYNRDNNAAV